MECKKARSNGTWPSLGDLDSSLRTPVNISRTAKAIGFKFSMRIDCKEWKISSTKISQRGHSLRHNDLGLLLDFGISSILNIFCNEYIYRLQIW